MCLQQIYMETIITLSKASAQHPVQLLDSATLKPSTCQSAHARLKEPRPTARATRATVVTTLFPLIQRARTALRDRTPALVALAVQEILENFKRRESQKMRRVRLAPLAFTKVAAHLRFAMSVRQDGTRTAKSSSTASLAFQENGRTKREPRAVTSVLKTQLLTILGGSYHVWSVQPVGHH